MAQPLPAMEMNWSLPCGNPVFQSSLQLPKVGLVHFLTIAAIQPPLYGAEMVTTLPPSIVFFIRR